MSGIFFAGERYRAFPFLFGSVEKVCCAVRGGGSSAVEGFGVWERVDVEREG